MKKEKITKNRGGDEYTPAPGISSAVDSFDSREICILLNDMDYFLHRVFIITERIGCRLLVIQSGQVKTNRFYDELRGAKIAFARMYNRKSRRKGVKANWTHLYKPYSGWLDEKLKMLRKQVSI